MTQTENGKKGKNNKGAVVVAAILLIILVALGVVTAIMFRESEKYKSTVYSLENEKTELTERLKSLEKELFDAQSNLNVLQNDLSVIQRELDVSQSDLLATQKDLSVSQSALYAAQKDLNTVQKKYSSTDYAIHTSLVSAMSKVTTKDSYGSFPGKVIAVKKGELVTVQIPYKYDGTIYAWPNDTYYEFDWKDSSVSGMRKFTVKGISAGIHTLRVNAKESQKDGITVVIWVYE